MGRDLVRRDRETVVRASTLSLPLKMLPPTIRCRSSDVVKVASLHVEPGSPQVSVAGVGGCANINTGVASSSRGTMDVEM